MGWVKAPSAAEKEKWKDLYGGYEDVNVIDGIPFRKMSDLDEWKEKKKAEYDANPYNEKNYANIANGKPTASNPNNIPRSNLKVNEESITSFINLIDSSVDEINSTWNSIVTTDIETIKNSWASTDAANYIDKLLAEGDKINNVIDSLQLLANTYQKVLQEHAATEQEVTGSINNI